MTSALLRQDVIPMVAGYLLVMGALGLGLRLSLRSGPGRGPGSTAGPEAADANPEAAEADPAAPGMDRRPAPLHWRRLARYVAGTMLGGYLLLVTVVILYYYLVARVGGAFIKSAFTGCAMLIGLAAPVFAAASWLTERRRHRPAESPAPRTGAK
jgi:hypothetical protein